jgi:hypothetical protein
MGRRGAGIVPSHADRAREQLRNERSPAEAPTQPHEPPKSDMVPSCRLGRIYRDEGFAAYNACLPAGEHSVGRQASLVSGRRSGRRYRFQIPKTAVDASVALARCPPSRRLNPNGTQGTGFPWLRQSEPGLPAGSSREARGKAGGASERKPMWRSSGTRKRLARRTHFWRLEVWGRVRGWAGFGHPYVIQVLGPLKIANW